MNEKGANGHGLFSQSHIRSTHPANFQKHLDWMLYTLSRDQTVRSQNVVTQESEYLDMFLRTLQY